MTIYEEESGYVEMILYTEVALETLEQLAIKKDCGYTVEHVCTWMLSQYFQTPAEA